jgi:hypothetical protein
MISADLVSCETVRFHNVATLCVPLGDDADLPSDRRSLQADAFLARYILLYDH